MRKIYQSFKNWGNEPFACDINILVWPKVWFHFSWMNDEIVIGLFKINR